VKGFFIRLVPDCVLPTRARRTKFHDGEREDAGSMRKYQWVLSENDGISTGSVEVCVAESARGRPRVGLLKRWLVFGRRQAAWLTFDCWIGGELA
jgi:hypothetical protein